MYVNPLFEKDKNENCVPLLCIYVQSSKRIPVLMDWQRIPCESDCVIGSKCVSESESDCEIGSDCAIRTDGLFGNDGISGTDCVIGNKYVV